MPIFVGPCVVSNSASSNGTWCTNGEAPKLHDLPVYFATASSKSLEPPPLLSPADDLLIGFYFGVATVLLTIAGELCSIPTVRKVLRQPGGRKLYGQALMYNVVNNLIIGPITYAAVAHHLCAPQMEVAPCASIAVGMLVAHGFGYYFSHMLMHRPRFYWMHKFHHRFHSNVTPVAANAVSFGEYAVAYMLPFVVGSAIVRPDRLAVLLAATVISLNNILIHAPSLDWVSTKLPWWACATHDHLEHHERLTTLYAAPTLSIDRILLALRGEKIPPRSAFKTKAR